MTDGSSLGEFLRNRRGRLRPQDVGLPPGHGRRQTPGLRREEVSALAGVSVDYLIRLEQGRDANPGPGVLDALANALRLDDDERAHLRRLTDHNGHRRPDAPATPRPGLVALLASVRPTPAYVLSPCSDILAANPEGLDLLVGIGSWPPARRNIVRYVFTHPAARDLFQPWQDMAEDSVAHLRTVDPDAPSLVALATELSAASVEFASLWRHYDVRVKRGARRTFRHPSRGRIELTSEILTAPDGQRFAAFQAAPSAVADGGVAVPAVAQP